MSRVVHDIDRRRHTHALRVPKFSMTRNTPHYVNRQQCTVARNEYMTEITLYYQLRTSRCK